MTPETSASNEINWFLRKVSVYAFFLKNWELFPLITLERGFCKVMELSEATKYLEYVFKYPQERI